MRIFHKSKRFIAPHPQVSSLIADILATPTEGLAAFLRPIAYWKWPRSDLNAWIKVLNKFDAILEEAIRDYNVDTLQVNDFSSQTKDTILEILRFERLLLENSTNRKMFNSYDRLNSFMFTSDLDILVMTLHLLLRPSQQYSSQPALSHSLHISTSRLESLARAPPSLREHGVEMIDLVAECSDRRMKNLPAEVGEVNFTFYKIGDDHSEKEGIEADIFETKPSSSRPVASGSSHSHTIHLGPLSTSSQTSMQILADAIQTHQVPDNDKYELLCRIRAARAMDPDREEERENLVIARLLSIAVYAHTHPETQAQSSLFLYDADLVNRIAELLQLDRGISVKVQTAALGALDALARYRSKIQEVLAAVNAGVNHGTLMSLFRKTVLDITDPESNLPNSLADALLSFIIYIASHSAGGNMVVGAGLIPLLIQVIGITNSTRLPVVSKTMQLIDNVLYGFMNAFTLFCNGHGVEALTDRIQFEVEKAISSFGSDEKAHCASSSSYGLLQFSRAGVLKHILRSMHRMMQSSGTTEGMRGLIDSSLLTSVDKIIEYRGIFGPTVLPIAINIVATFVHNEPTSLTAIQEAKLPETIYNALEVGIEPSIEVIQAVPNVIGALCLNQTGQDQLATHPSIIPALFAIFTSEKHLKILQDKENAASVGGSIDELIRHHPLLKNVVFKSLLSTLSKLEDLGNAYSAPSDIASWYTLSLSNSSNTDVPMEDVQPSAEVPADSSSAKEEPGDEAQTKAHDNLIVNFIDVFGRFLEGLFQHPAHCKDFINDTDGLDRITRLLTLPCLPYDYSNSPYSDSLVQVIRTMTEVAPTETLTHLSAQVKASLRETEDYWQVMDGSSKFLNFVDITDEEQLARGNDFFRRMVTLHARLTLLSDVYSAVGYAHGRNAVGLLQDMVGLSAADIVPTLGALHRVCIWENIVLKNGLAAKGITVPPKPETEQQSTSPSNVVTSDGELPPASPVGLTPLALDGLLKADEQKQSPKVLNALAFKHIAIQIPNALGPFFQSISKILLYGRRNLDDMQKKQAADVSAVLAEVMFKHLVEFNNCQLDCFVLQLLLSNALHLLDEPSAAYAYHTVMLGFVTVLIFDDRASQSSHHAVLLLQLRKLGGIEAILNITRRYIDTINRITALKVSDRSESDQQEMVHVFGGLKMAFHLLHLLISLKPSIDSGQVASYISRDKPESHPEFYEPHDFLVKMRLAISPLILEIWQAPWLVSAPPAVSKYVIQSVQEIIAGENEVARSSDFSQEILPAAGIGLLRPSGPDEDRVRQLTDMGFPRASAIRALTRTNNNISFATEYLLTHPAEPEEADEPEQQMEPETVEQESQTPSGESAEAHLEDSENSMQTEDNIEESANQEAPAIDQFVSEKSVEERRQDLEVIRKSYATDIGSLALRLIDVHPSLIFDVRQMFIGPSDGYQAEAIRCILSDVERFSPAAYDVQEEPLAMRCRLLALILVDAPKVVLEISGSEERSLMDMLHALLLSQPIGIDKDQPLPKWLPALLLAMESLLILAEEPRSVRLALADEPVIIPELLTGPPHGEARATLFDLCIRLLNIPTLPRDEFLATLRILVLLTRSTSMAEQFVQRDGVSLLLQGSKAPSGDAAVSGFQTHIAVILRHLIENHVILETIMKQEVHRWFTSARNRPVEVLSFIRNSASLAARNPQVFVEVANKLCTLARPDVPNHQILLKQSVVEQSQSSNTQAKDSAGKSSQMQIDSEKETPPSHVLNNETIEAVVHFMLSELLRVGKAASDKLKLESTGTSIAESSERPPTSSAPVSQTAPVTGSDPLPETSHSSPRDQQDDHYYACFLMQSLSELLLSYEQCKIAFLTYPKKRGQTPVKDVLTRPRSAALNFILSELISFGAFNVEPKFDAKKRIILCNWAMSVIIALCVDNSTSYDASHPSTELSSIRKFVLESINRSIKDVAANESTDARYGRILALVDLCHRLLTVRFSTGPNRAAEETPAHIAKIMLEKNFVSTLTTILSDIDLNYPNMRNLIAAVLRPLEFLTKVAIKMGRATDKNKELQSKANETPSPISSDDEDEEMEMADEREETPDLYRNSSLGMYGGEMEEANYDDEDAMDEDEDDEDEDVDVEYDEETGSEDTSNTEEDVEDEGVIDAEVNGAQDEWQDIDEEMDEDEDNVDDEDSEDDLDDEADDEMMWQESVAGGGDVPEGLDEEPEDEDDMDGDLVDGEDQTHEADNADTFSNGEDLADELGELEERDRIQDAGDLFGFGRQVSRNLGIRSRMFFTSGGSISQSRDADVDMQIFGRPRYPNMSSEAMSHPLLVDVSGSASPSGQSRIPPRRSRGGSIPGNSFTDILQTIEDLVGGGAMQLVQQLMTQTGLGGADIRLEVPHPSGLLTNPERGQLHRQGRPGITASVRLRDARSGDGRQENPEFGPLPTLQRWNDEAKIVHGKHLQERVQKLSNHLILAMLPDARETAKQAKEKEDRERQEREAADKEKAQKESEDQQAMQSEGASAAVATEPIAIPTQNQPSVLPILAPQESPEQSQAESTINEDSEMLDVSAQLEDTVTRAETDTQPQSSGEGAVEVETEHTAEESGAPLGEGPSTTAERVTVTIHGNPVDITDTGIDPTFLEALPDDMREEVLNQHFREQRSSRVEQQEESQISPEFLDALPPELRAEILQQERLEQARRERQQRVGGQPDEVPAGPADIDTADFIASLDPQLRHVVLLDSDEAILQALPPHMIAEAGIYREGSHHIHHVRREPEHPRAAQAPSSRKPPQSRDAIQLLDRAGIASLMKLLFFTQLPKKHTLHKVLLNLCENSKTRTELFNLIISILQDGTGDIALVDKSFSQLSFRNTKGQFSAKVTGKQKESNTSPVVPSEVPPDLVAQRCLDALSFIVESNELASLFFLTEHELPAGLKRTSSKKGKGKEKQAAQSHYPIVLLLGLLDRQTLVKTPSTLDTIACLLDAVTRPLTGLKVEGKQKEEPTQVGPSTMTVTEQQEQPAESITLTNPEPDGANDNTGATANRDAPQDKVVSVEQVEERILLANPPQIPHPTLRLIVNILTIGECSGRTFQHTLALIQHLSYLTDARSVIAQELRVKAQEFGENLSEDLDFLIVALQTRQNQDLPPSVASKFSPASSEQAKLLRVLKTIDYMFSKASITSTAGTSQTETDDHGVRDIYENFRFAPLWRKLSEALTVVESRADIEHVATILLPLIESLMVVCKNVGVKASTAPGRIPLSPSVQYTPLPLEECADDLFVSFTDDHRKILNLMVRNNPSLMSGSFSLLVQNSRVLDFDNKRNYFNQQLHKRPHPREHYGTLQLNIRRARVFEDSHHAFQHKTGDQIKYGKLSVRFYGEEGVDAGGVTREWFQILARQMFDPNYALFEPCAADRQTYQPNRASSINPDHLSYFKFVGRVIGKAIYDGRLMDAHFARSLYRQLLGKRVDYRDVEWVDPEYYKSLCWILENDPTVLDLTFITEVDEFGTHAVFPLKENGTSIPVTMENRKEYVQLSAQYRLHSSIQEQIENLLSGFYEIIPKDLISIFNEQEVELLISGTPDIDVDEWRAATEYNGYSSSDPVIVWWWRALKSFNRDERAKVLSFATGTSRVPLGGFVDLQGVQGVQRFSIHRAYGNPDRLPQAHTCFNQIDLPQYSSYEKLRQQLLLAINEGGEGFGFA